MQCFQKNGRTLSYSLQCYRFLFCFPEHRDGKSAKMSLYLCGVCAVQTFPAWKIELPEPLTVSELDMAALFGNTLYVVSTNSFDGKVKKGEDGYHSTKHSGHGTGLISIAAVAEKCGGSEFLSGSGLSVIVRINFL